MNHARNITRNRLFLAILFSFLTVVGSGSVAFGDLLNAPNSGGRGLIGLVKPGGTVDDALRAHYLDIARSPQMAAAVERYNKIARFLGQKPSASIDDIVKALGDDVTFSIFVVGSDPVFDFQQAKKRGQVLLTPLPPLLKGDPELSQSCHLSRK